MSSSTMKVLAAGPGVVLGGSFESILMNGQPTLVTREIWLDNFSSDRVLVHYVGLGWSGDTSIPTVEDWPYLLLQPGKRQAVVNADLYFDFALRAREQHGESFGLLLQRAIGLMLTVKVVTVQTPAFLQCSLWVPKQDQPDYFMIGSQSGS